MIKSDTREILIPADEIQKKVKELADRISRDYADRELTLVAVLKGSAVFFADLVRSLSIDCAVDFILVSSYRGAETTGVVRLVTDLSENPVGKHLLLVEDIVDSGHTLDYLHKNLATRRPASVRTCVLLDKAETRRVQVSIDYRGFVIPDRFVVGYGLDYRERYRGLPYIGVLDQKTEQPASRHAQAGITERK